MWRFASSSIFSGVRPREKLLRQLAQERVAQSVDAFEMLEEQNQPFEMRGVELAVDAVERMRDGVRDRFFLQVALQVENVLAQGDDLGVLRFGNSPDEQVNLARILRKISRNLLADKCMR